MRVALFQAPHGFIAAYGQESGEAMVHYSRYTRISEYVDVEFPPLPGDVVAAEKIRQLEEVEQSFRAELQQKLNELAQARAKVLAPMPEVGP